MSGRAFLVTPYLRTLLGFPLSSAESNAGDRIPSFLFQAGLAAAVCLCATVSHLKSDVLTKLVITTSLVHVDDC